MTTYESVTINRGKSFSLSSVGRASLGDPLTDELHQEEAEQNQPIPSLTRHRLARAINELFNRKAWTIELAHRATGLSPETLIKLKSGDPTLRLSTVRRFAEAINEDPQYWLNLADCIELPRSSSEQIEGLLDVTSLPPAARAVARMAVDMMKLSTLQETMQVKDAVRLPMRDGHGLSAEEKIVGLVILGPDYVGLTGRVISHIAEMKANIINISARGFAGLATISIRVVVNHSVRDEDLQLGLTKLLNNRARLRGHVDKSSQFVVHAADEDLMVHGPTLGIELILRDKPGALESALNLVYKRRWVPIAVEHAILEKNGEQEAKSLLAIEPLTYDPAKSNMADAAALIADLQSHPDVIDARLAFD